MTAAGVAVHVADAELPVILQLGGTSRVRMPVWCVAGTRAAYKSQTKGEGHGQ